MASGCVLYVFENKQVDAFSKVVNREGSDFVVARNDLVIDSQGIEVRLTAFDLPALSAAQIFAVDKIDKTSKRKCGCEIL